MIMSFNEKLHEHITRVMEYKESVQTEEATKQSFIVPFFKMLGYDVLNPKEFIPEYTADVGIKKFEKIDYAIIIDEKPLILVECKSVDTPLDKHGSQLFRYFGTTDAKFGILTNGIVYKFFTDLENANKMDSVPFLTVDLENIQDRDIAELQKFTKETIDVDGIINSAENLKYSRLIKDWFANELENPSPEIVSLILSSGIYEGRKNQNVIDKFTPIVKRATAQYISDQMNTKIKAALAKDTADEKAADTSNSSQEQESEKNRIETTMDELEAFAIIKSILRKTVDSKRITYKDTASYFGILLDNNSWKWICRVYLQQATKYVIIAGENKEQIRYDINSVDDIFNCSDDIVAACKRYL